jgi:glycosyltransferase involved in cell wall biosynthesis
MRALILHSQYLSGDASGENRVVDDEATLLSRGGHHVRVWRPRPTELGGLGLVRTAAGAVWSRDAVRRVGAELERFAPDVVHVHNLFPSLSPAVIRAVTARGVPLVMTLHNYRLMCLPATFLRDGRVCEDCLHRAPWPGVVHGCYRGSVAGSGVLAASLVAHRGMGTFERTTLYLAVSGFLRAKYVEAGMSPDRIMVKSNFAWEAPRRDGPGEYFVFVGRLSPEKGIPILLRAWTDIPDRLLIVGDGPERARLEQMAPPGVEFVGSVPSEEVAPLLRRARALVLPSVSYEAQPRVLLEAFAAGVPAIASRIGGLADTVVDDASGMLVAVGDDRAWAEAAARMQRDDLSRRLGEGAYRAWLDRYSPERALAALEDAYARAVSIAAVPDRGPSGPVHP